MATNRAVAYMGPRKLEIQNLDFPKLVDPRGKACHHGVILKIVTTNICGSDQHIYRGRFPAPEGDDPGPREHRRSPRSGPGRGVPQERRPGLGPVQRQLRALPQLP